MDTKPNLEEAYKMGYLSPAYHRDRDMVEKYDALRKSGRTKSEAVAYLIELMDYGDKWIYKILKKWNK